MPSIVPTLMALPLPTEIAGAAQAEFAALDKAFALACEQRAFSFLGAVERGERDGGLDTRQLSHRLSEDFEAFNPQREPARGRSVGEATLCEELLRRVGGPLDAAQLDLASMVNFVGGQLGVGGLRKTACASVPDRFGYQVRYPPAAVIGDRLIAIGDRLAQAYVDAPAFAASLAACALCNLHPLADGNGRLSRIVFNVLLRSVHGTRFYLPIYEMSALSRGGYLIHLREAQYWSEWSGLASWLRRATDAFVPVAAS